MRRSPAYVACFLALLAGVQLRAFARQWAAGFRPLGPAPGRGALSRFRAAFAAIWLAYDLLDLAFGGTARQLWPLEPRPWSALALLQGGLVAAEAGLLAGWRARELAALCFALRAAEAGLFLHL